MVTFVKGDIFESSAQKPANTVNCVGVMGKGVALEFKNLYRKRFGSYKTKSDLGKVKPGQPYPMATGISANSEFSTQRNWRGKSLLQDYKITRLCKMFITSYRFL